MRRGERAIDLGSHKGNWVNGCEYSCDYGAARHCGGVDGEMENDGS